MTIIPWMEMLNKMDKVDGLGEPDEYQIAFVEAIKEVSDVGGLELTSNFSFMLIGSLMESFTIEEWKVILDGSLEMFKTVYSQLDWGEDKDND